MDEASIALLIKSILNNKLTDPYSVAGGTARTTFCHTDKPLVQATYPRIQIKKLPGTNDIISIGTSYAERSFAYFNIFFYTKVGFKNTVTINGVSTEIKDENLVNYYLERIKDALKNNQSTTQGYGVDGFKKIGTSEVFFDPDTKCNVGYITCRYWWFTAPS